MGFSSKAKSNNSENWGMGFLFVFLPEEDTKTSSSSLFKQPIISFLKITNSSHLLTKAQSTISICALLVFITLLLFTLSTFEPSSSSSAHHFPLRRQLYGTKTTTPSGPFSESLHYMHALQGMGTLYRRGTRAMHELIVAHVTENITTNELKIFLRLLHRSGITSRSDVLIISSSKTQSISVENTIAEENNSFLKLIDSYSKNSTRLDQKGGFEIAQFLKLSKKERQSGEPIWGKKIRSNSSDENGTESTRPSYGSVVGFDVEELDPENSLAGFLEHVPMSLRRWACYPMLLGRVRRNFKYIMLLDVKEILLLSDPLGLVRSKSPETVYLSTVTQHSSSGKRTSKISILDSPMSRHGKTKSEKTKQNIVSPAIIIGGARGVRRLSSAMLTEIVRGAMQHKKKNMVNELGLFNQLVGNENLLKNVNLITSTESKPELSSLTELLNSKKTSLSTFNFTMVRSGNSNSGLHSAIVKHICSFSLDSKAYNDC
ncbi:hypothetical protein LIER_43386 [Lithospermum erythrorhizon]|uniref:DUF7780 domain-containing protein n=1 Tax=Lithospermum erythrorhizon TaxID=34254 RepID=A0AAV3Q0J3_LITER